MAEGRNLSGIIKRQKQLAERVVLEDHLPETLRYVAGTDVAFPNKGQMTRAAIVVLDYPGLKVVEHSVLEQPTDFPYIPGFLSFREVPALLRAFEKLRTAPDLVLCDGQGIAHPRRFGLACHFGIETGLPTIGVAKSRLTGSYTEPGKQRGEKSALMDKGEQIGTVLRTRDNVKPLFISAGHRVTLSAAVARVLDCGGHYRLPEPTRMADKLAGAYGQKSLI